MVAGSHSSAWPKEDYPKVYWSVLCCRSLVLWKQPTTKIVLWPLGLLAPKIHSSFDMPLTQETRHRESLSSTQPPHLSWSGAAKYLCWGDISQELPGIEVVGFVAKYLTLVWKTRACKTQEEQWQLLPLLYAPAKLLHEDKCCKRHSTLIGSPLLFCNLNYTYGSNWKMLWSQPSAVSCCWRERTCFEGIHQSSTFDRAQKAICKGCQQQ